MSENEITIDKKITQTTQNLIEDELAYGRWLKEHQHLKGTIEYERFKRAYNDIRDYYASPKGAVEKVWHYGAGELNTIGDAVGKALSNPVEAGKKLIGGIGDVGRVAEASFLPDPLVDKIYKDMNNPDIKEVFGLPNERNQYYKNSENLNFLYTHPREKYEAMGKKMGEHYGGVWDKLTDSPQSALKLITENPLESLLNFGGAASLLKLPIKATGLLGINSKVGKIVDNITDQSSSSLISGVPQILKSRANKKGAIKKQERAKADAEIAAGVKEGYVLTPDAYQGNSLLNKLSSFISKAPILNVKGKAILTNQDVTNKLARRFTGLKATDALEDVMSLISKKHSSAYQNIKNLKQVKKTIKGHEWVNSKILGANGQPIKIKIPSNKSKVVHRSGKDLLYSLINKRTKHNSLIKNENLGPQRFDDALKITKDIEKLELDILMLAKHHKLPTNVIKKLTDARIAYAKGYSVGPYINNGNLNVGAFAKHHKNNSALTGDGKIMRDFANNDTTKGFIKLPDAQTGQLSSLENWALYGTYAADLSTGGLLSAAREIFPRMLLSNQNKFINPNYGAGGLLNTLGNPNIVRNAALIPSLLNSSQIEDLPYLDRTTKYLPSEGRMGNQ